MSIYFQDNWAMIYAQNLAVEHNIPLHVCFTLPEKFRAATIRQYGFIIKGLQEMEKVYSTFIPYLIFVVNI